MSKTALFSLSCALVLAGTAFAAEAPQEAGQRAPADGSQQGGKRAQGPVKRTPGGTGGADREMGNGLQPDTAPQAGTVKKLGSVTWDLKTHKLVWVVESGSIVSGKFVPVAQQEYSVSPDEAVMSMSGEQRGFAEEEATSLQHVLDILTVYCAESVVWWDQGQGTPVNGKGLPRKGNQPDEKTVPGQRPVKVRDQAPVRVLPAAFPVTAH